MKVESHILDHDGNCSRCGLRLVALSLPADTEMSALRAGDRIGVISGLKFSLDAAYQVKATEHDSNRLCEPKKG